MRRSMMIQRRFLVSGCLLLAAAVAAAPAFAAKPKIVFPVDAKNFGKIKQGAEASYEFVFRNDGDAKLTIHNVETSCGCTALCWNGRKRLRLRSIIVCASRQQRA